MLHKTSLKKQNLGRFPSAFCDYCNTWLVNHASCFMRLHTRIRLNAVESSRRERENSWRLSWKKLTDLNSSVKNAAPESAIAWDYSNNWWVFLRCKEECRVLIQDNKHKHNDISTEYNLTWTNTPIGSRHFSKKSFKPIWFFLLNFRWLLSTFTEALMKVDRSHRKFRRKNRIGLKNFFEKLQSQ